eukprot:6188188-Pleurochrysis_carterae.AAC.1
MQTAMASAYACKVESTRNNQVQKHGPGRGLEKDNHQPHFERYAAEAPTVPKDGLRSHDNLRNHKWLVRKVQPNRKDVGAYHAARGVLARACRPE